MSGIGFECMSLGFLVAGKEEKRSDDHISHDHAPPHPLLDRSGFYFPDRVEQDLSMFRLGVRSGWEYYCSMCDLASSYL